MDEQREVKKEYNNFNFAQKQINNYNYGKENEKFSLVSEWDIEVGNINDELSYKNKSVNLMGRNQELQWINNFLDSPIQFKVSAITGGAWSGKSRLVYEYFEQNKEADWVIKSLSHKCLLQLNYNIILESMLEGHECNLLLIIDDVLLEADAIGEWILELFKRHVKQPDLRIRILLLERENVNLDKQPYWFIGINNRCKSLPQKSFSYNDFLVLEDLDSSVLEDIFIEYVRKKKPYLDVGMVRQQAEKIIKKLDADSKNPLIVQYIADAWLQNRKCTTWSRKEVLERIVEKEMERLKKVCLEDVELIENVEKMYMFSIAVNGTEFGNNGAAFLQENYEYIKKKTKHRSISAIFEVIGSDSEKPFIKSNLPDIIREYYFLQYLVRKYDNGWDDGYVQEFIQQAWVANPSEFSKFLCRILDDFTHHCMVSFDGVLKMPQKVNDECVIAYSNLLREYSYYNEHVEEYYSQVESYFEKNLLSVKADSVRKSLCDNYAVALFNMIWWYDKEDISYKELQKNVDKINLMCDSVERGRWCMICRGIYAICHKNK